MNAIKRNSNAILNSLIDYGIKNAILVKFSENLILIDIFNLREKEIKHIKQFLFKIFSHMIIDMIFMRRTEDNAIYFSLMIEVV